MTNNLDGFSSQFALNSTHGFQHSDRVVSTFLRMSQTYLHVDILVNKVGSRLCELDNAALRVASAFLFCDPSGPVLHGHYLIATSLFCVLVTFRVNLHFPALPW